MDGAYDQSKHSVTPIFFLGYDNTASTVRFRLQALHTLKRNRKIYFGKSRSQQHQRPTLATMASADDESNQLPWSPLLRPAIRNRVPPSHLASNWDTILNGVYWIFYERPPGEDIGLSATDVSPQTPYLKPFLLSSLTNSFLVSTDLHVCSQTQPHLSVYSNCSCKLTRRDMVYLAPCMTS